MTRDWLKEARGAKTCKEVAGAVGITEPYYFLIEQGLRRPRGLTVEQVTQLAGAVGMDPIQALQQEMAWLKESSPH